MLKKATPYMIRKNGELIDVTPIHPYIKYILTDSDTVSIIKLINNNIKQLKWFYESTEFEHVKQDIELFLTSVLNNKEFASKVDIENIKSEFNIDFPYEPLDTIYDIVELFKLINNACNQEFLRLRTSSMRFGGSSGDVYFRVSSVNYNWFNTIWKIVYDNKNFITTVTICTDTQAKGDPVKFYQHNGVVINQLPVDDFINLSGNPIVESKNKNNLFDESTNIHPHHINRIIDELWDKYTADNFVCEQMSVLEAIQSLTKLND